MGSGSAELSHARHESGQQARIEVEGTRCAGILAVRQRLRRALAATTGEFPLIRAHQVQQRAPDGHPEQVVDDVQHNELPDLTPDFGFIRGADVEQQ